MVRRRPPALAAAILAAALGAGCGGGPAAPALPAPFVLTAGRHTLTISVWTPTSINPYGFTSSQLVCVGRGATSASFPVDVTSDGTAWLVRAGEGTLTLRLAGAAAGHAGTIAGASTHNGVSLVINDGSADAPASLPAGAASPTSFGGRIDGAVRFVSAQGEQSCSHNAWTLTAVR